jgi:hypothetical protein
MERRVLLRRIRGWFKRFIKTWEGCWILLWRDRGVKVCLGRFGLLVLWEDRTGVQNEYRLILLRLHPSKSIPLICDSKHSLLRDSMFWWWVVSKVGYTSDHICGIYYFALQLPTDHVPPESLATSDPRIALHAAPDPYEKSRGEIFHREFSLYKPHRLPSFLLSSTIRTTESEPQYDPVTPCRIKITPLRHC